MGKDQDIVFRRINGRIVPIKQAKKSGAIPRAKKQSKSESQKAQRNAGIFGLGSGVGSGLLGGYLTKKAERQSAKAARAAGKATKLAFKANQIGSVGEQLDLFKRQASRQRAENLLKRANRLRIRSKFFEKAASKTRLGALTIGGSLIGAGIENIIESSDAKKNPGAEFAKDVGVNLASGAVAAAFILGTGKKINPKKGLSALSEIVKKASKRGKQMRFRF